jgi:hypothetical protein
MDHEMNQLLHERDVRILAAKYSDDALNRTVLALDHAIRRAAWRVLGLQTSRSEGSSISRSTPGSSTS